MDTIDRDMVQAWLGMQCSMVAGVSRAVIILDGVGQAASRSIVVWPQDAEIPGAVRNAAQQAFAERRRIVEHGQPAPASATPPSDFILALPVQVDGVLSGAFAVQMSSRNEQQQRAALQVFAWGAAWLELLLRRQRDVSPAYPQALLEVVAQAVAAADADACAVAVVNELARQLSCERVTIGFVHGQEVRVQAVSDAARIENKLALVRALAAAMHEAIDQDRCIVIPADAEAGTVIDSAHRALLQHSGERALCSVPLYSEGRCHAALILERDPARPFDRPVTAALETLSLILGPIVADKRQRQAAWLSSPGAVLRGTLEKFTGSGHLMLKALTLALLLGLGLGLLEGDYRIDAPASLEGRVQRAVVAPFDGFLAEAPVRAGDVVGEGQMLCRLEDRDLQLEHARWSSEQAQLMQSHREAMANHDRSELGVLRARLDQAAAKLALVEEKLARTRLLAPLSGLVVKGDLSQSLGMPLERGQLLFEIAPLDAYRIMLEVDERDVAQVAAGQRGQLALAGLPQQRQAFTVRRILPVARAAEGNNRFLVEAELDRINEQLRPGMRGVGKIEAGSRKLFWIWTHRMFDWFRLSFWKWL